MMIATKFKPSHWLPQGGISRLCLMFYGIMAVGFCLSMLGCGGSSTHEDTAQESSPTTDLYPDKVVLKHAQGFSIRYAENYKLIEIYTSADTSRYVLLERGTKAPQGLGSATTIEIPIRNMVAMSSMHIGMLTFLESEKVLAGLGSLQYVYSPKVLELIAAGKIKEVGIDQGIDQEKLLVMHPDLVMTMGGPESGRQQFPVLQQAAIPVLANAEWLETTPLARAEWVKLLAALLNKEALANKKFAQIEEAYHRLKNLASAVPSKPQVLSGLNTKDSWYLPAGDNYMAVFFKDAGGAYPWHNTAGNASLPLNFESVYPKALTADIWLNVGFDPADTQQGILAIDTRYADFKSVKTGKMYSYNNRVNDGGANDFFESGMMAPEVVLADLIKILHPDLLPEHTLVYYKHLPK
ncbi:ABC transporter substrate-binding protein [Dyadobacter jejuensis]|nr:ABC transporter substrate-binding protein [Dyadobacter jejuensis]